MKKIRTYGTIALLLCTLCFLGLMSRIEAQDDTLNIVFFLAMPIFAIIWFVLRIAEPRKEEKENDTS